MCRRLVTAPLLVAVLALSGCSADAEPAAPGSSTSSTRPVATGTTPVHSPATDEIPEPLPTLPALLTDLGLDLDIDLAWMALCTAWRFDDHYDEAVINEALHSLFANNPDNSSNISPDQLDAAMGRACAELTTAAGIAAGLRTLRLESDDMERFIDDACSRYVHSVRGVPGGQQFDETVSGPLGLDHEEMTGLVIDICGQDAFDDYVEPIPPSILPSDATPGEVDPAFDAAAACTTEPTPPPIDEALAAQVLAAYELDAADHEVQRLIPFELGGATTAANLFPIAIDAHPGANDKHGVDALVIEMFCNGEVTLQEAGVALIISWPTAVPTLRNL